jgi:hypothetical protein
MAARGMGSAQRKKRKNLAAKIKRLGKKVSLGNLTWHQYNAQVDALVSKSLRED